MHDTYIPIPTSPKCGNRLNLVRCTVNGAKFWCDVDKLSLTIRELLLAANAGSASSEPWPCSALQPPSGVGGIKRVCIARDLGRGSVSPDGVLKYAYDEDRLIDACARARRVL
jgi:hypothetical protein